MQAEQASELSGRAQVIARIITAAHEVVRALEKPGQDNEFRAILSVQFDDQRNEIARLTRHTRKETEDFLMGECEVMARDLERRFGIVAGVHIPK